jgi:hypothetical protein
MSLRRRRISGALAVCGVVSGTTPSPRPLRAPLSEQIAKWGLIIKKAGVYAEWNCDFRSGLKPNLTVGGSPQADIY